MKNEGTNLKTNIIKQLAEYLGIEPEDIDEEDSLISDLHMKPSDLTDFMEMLDASGIDTSKIDLTEIETVGELMEEIGADDYLS